MGVISALYPKPALVIGSYDEDGKPNMMTAAWVSIANSDPLSIAVSMRPATYSYHNLSNKKFFTVNIPSEELTKKFSCDLNVNADTPNTFIVHAADDQSVAVENSINYYLALKNNKIKSELHLYEKGGHGFGLGVIATSKNWIQDCENWIQNNGYTN